MEKTLNTTNKKSDGKVVKEWSPNATQKDFLETLENYPDGTTLKDIEIDTGKVFKSGALNVLTSKGLVETTDGTRESDIVYRGVVIGKKHDTIKIYKKVK